MPFFIIFIIIPLIELFVFLSVSDEIGIFQTLLLCFLTAVIGGFLVRQQGLETLFRGQKIISSGQLPLEEIFNGFCIAIAGAMLITPGFMTDIVGFSLLVPTFRVYVRSILSDKVNLKTSQTHQQDYKQSQPSDIIDGDYERVDDLKD